MHKRADALFPAGPDDVGSTFHVDGVKVFGLAPDTGLACRMHDRATAAGRVQQVRVVSDVAFLRGNAVTFQVRGGASL